MPASIPRMTAYFFNIAHITYQHLARGWARAPLGFPAIAIVLGLWCAACIALPVWFWLVIILAATGLAFWHPSGVLVLIFVLGSFLGPVYDGDAPALKALDNSDLPALEVLRVDSRIGREMVQLAVLESWAIPIIGERLLWWRYTTSGDTTQLMPGDTVRIRGSLSPGRRARNPGEFDYRAYLWTQDIQLLITGPTELLSVTSPKSLQVRRFMAGLRTAIRAQVHEWMEPDRAAIALALLLGDKGLLDADTKATIRAAGISHLLAVSGLHVGFILVLLMGFAQVTRLVGGWRFVLILSGLIFYVALTNAPASVVRASIMAALYAAGSIFARQPRGWNILAAAAILSLLGDPKGLYGVGFQLSFSAVIGILYLHPVLTDFIKAGRFGPWLYGNRPSRYVLNMLTVSMGAQLGTLPWQLIHFQQVPIYGLITNLVAIPLAGFALGGTVLALVIQPINSWIALQLANASEMLILLIKLTSEITGGLPSALLYFAQPDSLVILLLCGTLLAIPWVLRGPGRVVLLRGIIIVQLVAAIVVWRQVIHRQYMEVTFLDVGQGDAAHVALPDGRHILIDGGRRIHRDMGERVVLPYLRNIGIDTLDLVIVSHPHNDHFGGLLSVLAAIPTREFWASPHQTEAKNYLALIKQLTDQGATQRIMYSGAMDRLGDVKLYVLAPDSLQAVESENPNDASLVIKLVYGENSLLMVGDAEQTTERLLAVYGTFLRSDWLKTGHHGSRTSSRPDLLEAVGMQGAVISVGEGNSYGHPDPIVLERLSSAGAVIHRTDEQQALRIRSDGKHWEQVSWRR